MGTSRSRSPAQDSGIVRLDLDSTLQAPGQARRLVRQALLDWRLPGLVDTVVLAVSELVTNAVRHGRPPVRVALRRTPREVVLDVHDGAPAGGARSARPAAGTAAESGRGLAIVEALSLEVIYEQVPDDGKVVHVAFEIAAPPPDV